MDKKSMVETKKSDRDVAAKDRREFLRKAAGAAVAAPAVALLVSASAKPAEAQGRIYRVLE